MIRRLLRAALGRLRSRFGRPTQPPRTAARPAAQPPLRPAPRRSEDDGHRHDHGHDHGHRHGHDHGHGHEDETSAPDTHRGTELPEEAPPRPVDVWPSDTPNPAARKFTASVRIVERGTLVANSAEEAARHPLTAALWDLAGVTGVFAVHDFVTVTRDADTSWEDLAPRVVAALQRQLRA
jgi:hypothetical protein